MEAGLPVLAEKPFALDLARRPLTDPVEIGQVVDHELGYRHDVREVHRYLDAATSRPERLGPRTRSVRRPNRTVGDGFPNPSARMVAAAHGGARLRGPPAVRSPVPS